MLNIPSSHLIYPLVKRVFGEVFLRNFKTTLLWTLGLRRRKYPLWLMDSGVGRVFNTNIWVSLFVLYPSLFFFSQVNVAKFRFKNEVRAKKRKNLSVLPHLYRQDKSGTILQLPGSTLISTSTPLLACKPNHQKHCVCL